MKRNRQQSSAAVPAWQVKRRYRLHSGWIAPRIKALVVTALFFSVLFLFSGLFVVFSVAPKSEHYFCPPEPISRPRMELKKLQVPVNMSKDKSAPKPKLRKRVVASKPDVAVDEIQIPEISGVKGGMDYYVEDESSLGFSMPAEPAPQRVQTVSGASIQRPKMRLKKPKVKVLKHAKPLNTTRIVTKVRKAGMPDIQLPEMSGTGMGDIGAEGTGFAGFELEDATESVSVFGAAVSIEETDGAGEDLFGAPAAQPAEWDDDLFFGEVAAPAKTAPAPAFNPYILAAENAFSTVSIDVDTASYGLARRKLLDNTLPEPESVRTEEFINSFDYNYRPPAGRRMFSVHKAMAPSPFRPGTELLKIGIKGRRIGRDDHRGAVLTLVIDTSGSMSTPERLGLVKKSLALLLDRLDPEDRVAIVQFGAQARLVKEHTPARDKAALLAAIDALQPGGPTQFDQGLQLGYEQARTGFSAGDSNRIIILSDGVANLGELDPEEILAQVGENRKKGIYLSVLGFGAGTYDDDLLERLANRGDGTYVYIDSMEEAHRVFVEQLASTLHVIASDVKIQVEFNPDRVLSYRQIGYENRQLTKEQFRDDSVDAGEVGSGQSVTALYEVKLRPGGSERDPVATVYVRYRRADNGVVEEISSVVRDSNRWKSFEQAPPRFRLAACAAEFAERLRRSPYSEGIAFRQIQSRLIPVITELELDRQVKELSDLMNRAAVLQ